MMTINEIMTTSPITLGLQDTLKQAHKLMLEIRIRHIPITDAGNKLLGIVTQRDVLAHNVAEAGTQEVKDIMRDTVYTISENEDIRAAGLKMQQYKIGSLVVINDNYNLTGIITDSDYVALALNLLEQLEETEPMEPDDYDELDDVSGFEAEQED